MREILFGDPNQRLIILDGNGTPQLGYLQIENASLASQAVGPLLSVGVTDATSCLTSGPDALFQRGCQICFSGAGPGLVGHGIGGNCSICHGGTIPGTSPAVQAALSSAAFQGGSDVQPHDPG